MNGNTDAPTVVAVLTDLQEQIEHLTATVQTHQRAIDALTARADPRSR